MSETLNRLSNLSRIVAVLAKVLLIFMAIGMAAAAVIMVIVAVDPDISVFEDPAVTSGQVLSMCATVLAAFAIGVCVMYYVDRLFTNIHKSNTPFSDENTKYLEAIAILMIAGTIVVPVISTLAALASDSGQDAVVSFNILILFFAFIVYCLSLVFKYGAALQKESDETL